MLKQLIQKVTTESKNPPERRYHLRTIYQPEPPAGFVPRSNPSFAGLNRRWF